MNVLSLFDGMSCGQIALERAGIKVNNYYSCEIKSHAIEVTKKNYPKTVFLGDINNWEKWGLKNVDMIIGGSPCQDFSNANKLKLGLKGVKSSLAYVMMDIINHYQPKYYLIENVVMSGENLHDMNNLIGSKPIMINSSLVSAQSRKRFYWTNIGVQNYDLFGISTPAFKLPIDKKNKPQDILDNGCTGRDKSKTLLSSDSRILKTENKMLHRCFLSGFAKLIFKDKSIYLRVKENTTRGFVDIKENEPVDLSYIKSTTRRGRSMKKKCHTLLRRNEYYVFQNGDLRYFSQSELERLQTVPVGYTKMLNRNKAEDLLGDGWTIDIIAHIFNQLGSE